MEAHPASNSDHSPERVPTVPTYTEPYQSIMDTDLSLARVEPFHMEWEDPVHDRPLVFCIDSFVNKDKNHTVSTTP